MSIGTNADLQGIFGQVNSLLGQLPSGTTGSSPSFNAQEFFKLGNILNGSSSQAAGGTGENNQTANIIQSTINTVMSLINKITTQEAKAAREEVNKNTKAADKLAKEQEESRTELSQNIDNIEAQIITEKDTVINSTGNLEEISKQLQEKQEQLNELVTQIEEQQKALSTAKTPEEKAAILGTIQGLSGQIGELVGNLGDLQEQVTTLSQAVENSLTNIETAKGNAVTIQEDGEMQITKLAQEGANLVTQNTSTQVKGVTNSTTGASLEVAAEASSATIFSAGAAAKLYRTANDQTTAGQTRTTGSITNLQTVLKGIGGLQDNLTLLNNFKTAIGSSLGEFDSAVGEWNTSVSPIITSIGSFEAVTTGNEELKTVVTSDLSSLGYSSEMDEEGNVEISKNKNEDKKEENQETLSTLQTSEFDVQGKLNPFEKVKI